MYIFSILCDAMESMHKPHLLDTEKWWLSWEVLILQLELWPILTFFSFFFFLMEHRFSWRNSLLGYWAKIFLKMKKVWLSLKGKQLLLFVTNDIKFKLSAEIRILEFTCNQVFDCFPVFNDLSYEILWDMILTNAIF